MTSLDSKYILVTGFGPFGVHKINASWSIVEELMKEGLGKEIGSNIQLITQQLPVEYNYVQKEIPKLWKLYEPILVVHIGVHSSAHAVILETRAHNSEYHRSDECGCIPEGGCCMQQAPSVLTSTINLKAVHSELIKKFDDKSIELSNDPGRYLCDFTYYCSLMMDRSRVVFIHVPCIDSPYSLQQLTDIVKATIKELIQQMSRV